MHAMARGSRVLTPPYLLRLLADGYYEDKVMETYRSAIKLGTKRPKMLAAFMIESKSLFEIELFPIIRPRGGDFLYSDEEFEVMKAEARALGSILELQSHHKKSDKIRDENDEREDADGPCKTHAEEKRA